MRSFFQAVALVKVENDELKALLWASMEKNFVDTGAHFLFLWTK